MLEVRLLGQFDVRLEGEPVEIPSRPAQSLFAYLVLHPGKSHRRELLAGMFWPDSDEKNARSNLRHALWRLRKSIDEYIKADNMTVAFDPSARYQLDVERLDFEPDDTALEECFERLEGYQGELLPGFYDDWIVAERDRVEALFNQRMQQLTERLMREQRWAGVLEWAERWIARSSLPEEAFRALMQAHAALGDAAGVAMSYERLANSLHEDLGVEPSPQSQSLYKELTQGSSAFSARPAQPYDEAENEPAEWLAQTPTLPSFLQNGQEHPERTDVVGRDEELSELSRHLDSMLEGSGSVAFIVGEAGRGKTSLANVFARRAEIENEDLIVLVGGCDVYTGSDDPFQPFREIMSMMVGDVASHWPARSISREQAMRVWERSTQSASEVLRNAPILLDSIVPRRTVNARLAGDGAIDSSKALAAARETASTLAPHKNRILEEYTNVILGLAERSPLILILEDLHWIDPSSADLLLALAKSVPLSRVLIVGTYRPEEIRPGEDRREHPLRPALTEVKRRFGDVWIDLDAGDEARNRRMVESLIDREPNRLGSEFRQKLVEITAGHPLFVRDLLREMQERGDLVKNESGAWVQAGALNWDILPVRVEGVIEQRIGRIDAELREALSIASVQGELFFAEVVADVMGVDRNGLRRRFSRELEHLHRLVVEVSTERMGERQVSQFRFRHILIQRYLSQQLGQGELAHLHHATAVSIEHLFGEFKDRVAHRLARHFTEAGLSAEAVRYLAEAGRQALRASANQEAINLLDRALDLLALDEDRGQASDQSISSLLTARILRYSGEAYYRLGDLEESMQRLERALTHLGEAKIAGGNRLKVLLGLQVIRQIVHRLLPSSLMRRMGGDEEVLQERAYIYKMLAEVYLFFNDTVPTAYAALRALNTAELAGPSPELVRAYGDMAPAMPLLRLRRQGGHYRQRALRTAEEVGDPAATAYAHLSTGYYEAGEGDWGRARQSFERANQFHEAVGDLNLLGIGFDLLAHVAALEGQLGEHRSLSQDLLELSERSGSLQHKTWGLDGLALNAILSQGSDGLEEALALASDSLALIDQFPAATERMTVLTHLAEIRLMLGDEGEALSLCNQAADIMAQSPPASFALWTCYFALPSVLLELLERGPSSDAGDLQRQARWAAQQLRAFSKSYPIGRPRAEVVAGVLDFLTGRRKRGIHRCRTGIRFAEELGMPLEEAFAHCQLGRSLPDDDARRADHLSAAEDIYARHSARKGLELVQLASGRSGSRIQ